MVSKVVISTSKATEDVALLCGALGLRLFTTLGYNFWVEISTPFGRKYWKSPFKYLLDLLINKRIKIFLLAHPIGERPQPQQQPNWVWALPHVAISLIYATIYAISYTLFSS